MGFPKNAAALGEPDLKIGGLQIWVHGLEYAGAAEPYDADWLRVTAHCGSAGASVWASGAILTASGFERFAQGCHRLYESLQGSASLESYEPNLVATVSAADQHGHIGLSVEITPDRSRFCGNPIEQTRLNSASLFARSPICVSQCLR